MPAKQQSARKSNGSPPGEALPAVPRLPLADLRHDPAAIRRMFESGEYPYHSHLHGDLYKTRMLELQRELLKAQRWVESTGSGW